MAAEAVCAVDIASVDLNDVELTIRIKPSGRGGHLGRIDKGTLS